MNLDHLYLWVPPEDRKEVEALGARWDPDHLCWYLEPGDDRSRFSKWLPRESSSNGEELYITSEQAFVTRTTIPCQRCAFAIEVVCVFCESGTVDEEPLAQFTVSNISADAALAAKLAAWPNFRESDNEPGSGYANNCPRCGASQEDLYLHSGPEDPFFNISRTGSVRLEPLAGRIRLNERER